MTSDARPRDWVLISVFSLTGLYLFAISATELYGRRALDRGVLTTEARITHHELNPCRGFDCGPPTRVKYEFHTPDGEGPFHYTGQMLLFDAWVRVPSDVWDEALASKRIAIRYSISDPRINEPMGETRYSSFDGGGLMTLAFGMFGCALVVASAGRRDARPVKSASAGPRKKSSRS